MVFLYPIVNGKLDLTIVEKVKNVYPDIYLVLMLEGVYRNEIKYDWRFIFVDALLNNPFTTGELKATIDKVALVKDL